MEDMILGVPGDTESETSVLRREREAESVGKEALTGHRGATKASADAGSRQMHGKMFLEGNDKCRAVTQAPNAMGSKGGRQTGESKDASCRRHLLTSVECGLDRVTRL